MSIERSQSRPFHSLKRKRGHVPQPSPPTTFSHYPVHPIKSTDHQPIAEGSANQLPSPDSVKKTFRLTKNSLRRLRRHLRTNSQASPPIASFQPPKSLDGLEKTPTPKLKAFARGGGPDLRDIVGVCFA